MYLGTCGSAAPVKNTSLIAVEAMCQRRLSTTLLQVKNANLHDIKAVQYFELDVQRQATVAQTATIGSPEINRVFLN